jgi:hypothetical protein
LDNRESNWNGSLPVPPQNAHFTPAAVAVEASRIVLCSSVAFMALFRLSAQAPALRGGRGCAGGVADARVP